MVTNDYQPRAPHPRRTTAAPARSPGSGDITQQVWNIQRRVAPQRGADAGPGRLRPKPARGGVRPLDQVAALLLTKTTPRHGLAFTARALAAWWRLPDPDDLLAQFPPPVLAATVDRAVRYWSRAAQATYPEVAEAFRVDQAAIRKATSILQKRLQFSDTTNW
jgi:hypothetical protein